MDSYIGFIKLKMDNVKEEMNKILELLAENNISEDLYYNLESTLETQKNALRYFTTLLTNNSAQG